LLLVALMSTQHVGGFFPAGSALARSPFESKLWMFWRAVITLALVGLSPAL
jgi:hypothetical protein